ncbi:glutathione peroxidase [bacterium]|nr:glutathione peroxidase [bacterium]
MISSIYDFEVSKMDGTIQKLSEFKDKILFIVNVASKCGFTYQYEGLQKLYEKYKDQDFIILAFPANNFFWQEPGTNAEIQQFCKLNYGVTFPVFGKISVSGKKHPLYKFLTDKKTNPGFPGKISWNFNKFLIDKTGIIVNRFGSKIKPESNEVISAIEELIKK